MESVISELQIPTFRVKRPHKKTRTGCVTCKKRRVKCDETHPACNRCTSRGLACLYRKRNTEGSTRSPRSGSTSNDAATSSKSPSVVDESRDHLDIPGPLDFAKEAALAQHYLYNTWKTFAAAGGNASQDNVWGVVIPSIAFTCPITKNGMLALAALHLYCRSPVDLDDAATHLEVASQYGNKCLKENSSQLRNMTNPNLDSILACSRILCTAALAFLQVHRANGATLADSESWTWIQCIRGVQTVQWAFWAKIESATELLLRNDMAPEVPYPYTKLLDDSPDDYGQEPSAYYHLLRTWRAEQLPSLTSALGNHASQVPSEQADNFRKAIYDLEVIVDHICSSNVRNLFRAIYSWPVQIPAGYVTLLISGHGFARVIYAHWLMLTILVEDMWWVGDTGAAGLREIIRDCSSGYDHNLLGLLELPRRMLNAREAMRQ